MKPWKIAALAAAVVLLVLGIQVLAAGDGGRRGSRTLTADLLAFEEVPAISSTGSGEFRARISDDDHSIEFELSYENLEGETTTAAHIHLGQRSVNGAVFAFLCGGGGRPACTNPSGSFTGVITASDILQTGPPFGAGSQGILAGEFEEAVNAIRAGVTYANVHTNKHPGGEIRGQIRFRRQIR